MPGGGLLIRDATLSSQNLNHRLLPSFSNVISRSSSLAPVSRRRIFTPKRRNDFASGRLTMSGLLNSSLSGSSSNLQENTGRSFTPSFSGQSAVSSAFHHAGSIQGLHNTYGSYNVPNVSGTHTSRNSTMSGGVPQPSGGRFSSNNIPVGLSQISHGGSHGNSGVTNRGAINVVGSPGYIGSTNGIGGNGIGRNISSGGGLSIPGLTSRLNLSSSGGAGNLSMQGPNRLMSGVLQQASPQVVSMLGNSFPGAGGPLSHSHVQAMNNLNAMGVLNDMNNDSSPFDINDFPQLTSRPNSAGGPQGQLGSLRKGLGVGPIVQQNQEFSIQNEDFPALPGFKGSGADYALDLQQKEQLHENVVSMIQSQHFPMRRPAGFNLGGSYSSQRPQHQQHTPSISSGALSFSPGNPQDMIHLHGSSDVFPSSHSPYHSQNNGPPGIGLRRPLNSSNPASGISSYDQLVQQYQQNQQHNQPIFRLQQVPPIHQTYRDQIKQIPTVQAPVNPFGVRGLLKIINMSDRDLSSLALGIDLTSLGLNMSSTDNLYKSFSSPLSEDPMGGEPEFSVPQCYYSKQPPPLHQGYFAKFQVETLFFIFYSMPKDEEQIYAANELYNRGWFYHRELRLWLIRVKNMEPVLSITNACERGTYLCFDPNSWQTIQKENFVLQYEHLEKRPSVSLTLHTLNKPG